MATSDPAEDAPASRDPVELLVEEFFEQRRRGETPDAGSFARRVPGRDAEFLELIDALGVLERAASGVGRTPLELSGRLGRFALVRLVGRGGMGSVYEAIDDEAVGDERGRHVALKVLPIHAALDEREVARFHREAQAVARLAHPHIVPVLCFGEERGTHWLAMQFVPGSSLDRVLHEMRDGGAPRMAPKEVARHGIAIAEALACAHGQGVLHRDVKPSNVLLDSSGTVWVTDFGLAKSEGTATITRSGETVGTPRYMAPEAFLGFADPRTDVWGVGATLYELLAGRPAFDAQTRAKLSQQISDLEPTPLRRIDASLPVDLATIVEKCLQKEPAARYASAQALADDLARFVAGQPIRARPPSLGHRLTARLAVVARRHRGVVAAAVAGLIVLATISSLFVASLHRHNVRLEAATTRAEANLDVASAAIGELIEEVTADTILRAPALDPLRRKVLTAALGFELELLARQQGDPNKQFDVADAHVRVGFVHWELGQPDTARDHLQQAAASLRQLVATRRLTPRSDLLLARALEGTALVARQRGELAQAEAALREGSQVLAVAVGDTPHDSIEAQHLLTTATLLGDVLARSRRPLESIALLQATIDRAGGWVAQDGGAATRRALRNALYWLSGFEEQSGRIEAAVATVGRAVALAHEIASTKDPAAGDAELEATYRAQLAALLHELGRNEEARPLANQARTDLESMVARWPMSVGFRLDLASALVGAANAERACDPTFDVVPTLRRAVDFAQACADEVPDDFDTLYKLFSAQTAYAVARDDVGDVTTARDVLAQVMERAEAHLVDASQWTVQLVTSAAFASFDRGLIERKLHELEPARAAFERAGELADWLLAGDGSDRAARTLRLQIGVESAATLLDGGEFERAIEAWSAVEADARALLGGDLAVAARDVMNFTPCDTLVRALNLEAVARSRKGDLEGATSRLAEAIDVGVAFSAAWPDRVDFTAALGTAHADLGFLHQELRHDQARARGEFLLALGLLDRAVAKEPLQSLWHQRLAWVLDHLAGALDDQTELAPIVAAVAVAADHAPASPPVQVEAARVIAWAAELRGDGVLAGVREGVEKLLSGAGSTGDPWADVAMARLQAAALAGFADASRLETDVAFTALRGRADFVALIARLKEGGAARR